MKSINSINHKENDWSTARACICCDKLLGYTEQEVIPLDVLKKWKDVLIAPKGLKPELVEHYKYNRV